MSEYFYTREMVGNDWNIENPLRIDGEGNHIFLAREAENALPNKMFKLFCVESEVKFVFEEELSENEQTILGQVVYNHKNNL